MCVESIFIPSIEKKSIFLRLQDRFFLKKTNTHKENEDPTIITTLDRLSASSNNSELERVFTYFDENGDRKVSPTELMRCMKAIGDCILIN